MKKLPPDCFDSKHRLKRRVATALVMDALADVRVPDGFSGWGDIVAVMACYGDGHAVHSAACEGRKFMTSPN